MTIRILCFAQLKDRVGRSEWTESLPADSTGREVLTALGHRCPRAADLLGVCRIAVNGAYGSAEVRLQDGDEVAIIPPVSGG